MSSLSDAMDLLEAGDWEAAHRIVQGDDSRLGCWLHGIVHLAEGDRVNAAYWFGRAGRRTPSETNEIHAEMAELKVLLGMR